MINRQKRRRKEKIAKKTGKVAKNQSSKDKLSGVVKYYQNGQKEEAIREAVKILSSDPKNVAVMLFLGGVHYEGGGIVEAETLFRRGCTVEPANPDPWISLGLLCCHKKDLNQGIKAFEIALTLRPSDVIANVNLGGAYLELGEYVKAENVLRKALDVSNDPAGVRMKLGQAVFQLGRVDEGLKYFEEAILLEPTNAELLVEVSGFYRQEGNKDRVIDLLELALKINPRHAEAWFVLSMVQARARIEEHVDPLVSILNDPKSNQNSVISAGFALSHVFHRLGEYKKAFVHLEKANQRKRATLGVDLGRYEATTEFIFKTYDTTYLSKMKGNGFSEASPIFIFGMPRSGTTLVEQILASHSKTIGLGEYAGISNEVNKYNALLPIDSKDFNKIGRSYIQQIQRFNHPTSITLDKGLDNYFYIGLIHLALPKAKLINCTRNPTDNCFSCYQQLFLEGQDYCYNQIELGRYYQLYKKIIDHWHKVLPKRVFEVSYEDLVNNQYDTTRRLLGHCKLPYEEPCLNFYQTRRTIKTASMEQVRQPMYTTSVAKWKLYAEHIEDLINALGPYADHPS